MKFLRKMFIKANIGWCGSSSFKSIDNDIEPKQKLYSSSLVHHHPNFSPPIVPSSSSSSSYKENSTTSFSCNTLSSPAGSKLRDSVAIVKESNDPFLEFRHSMLEMIYEKEIYSKHELKELLDLFLQLNSASQHQAIVQAFMDIWNGVFSRETCENIEFDRCHMHGGY